MPKATETGSYSFPNKLGNFRVTKGHDYPDGATFTAAGDPLPERAGRKQEASADLPVWYQEWAAERAAADMPVYDLAKRETQAKFLARADEQDAADTAPADDEAAATTPPGPSETTDQNAGPTENT